MAAEWRRKRERRNHFKEKMSLEGEKKKLKGRTHRGIFGIL